MPKIKILVLDYVVMWSHEAVDITVVFLPYTRRTCRKLTVDLYINELFLFILWDSVLLQHFFWSSIPTNLIFTFPSLSLLFILSWQKSNKIKIMGDMTDFMLFISFLFSFFQLLSCHQLMSLGQLISKLLKLIWDYEFNPCIWYDDVLKKF